MQKRIQKLLHQVVEKPVFSQLWNSLILFNEKRGAVCAAGCSFFALISVVPLFLLVIRVVGWLIGNELQTLEQLIAGLNTIFPNIDIDVFDRLKRLLQGPLYATKSFTFFNLVLLTFSSLSLFNHIHSGLYLMTEEKRYLSLGMRIQGIVLIGFIISFVTFSLSVPVIIKAVIELLSKNWIMDFLWEYLPISRGMISWFASLGPQSGLFFKSQIFHGISFWLGFFFFYRWLFGWRRTGAKAALLSSGVFVFLILGLKYGFWIYFSEARAGLIQNYGDYYTIIVGMIWLFLAMCFFFYSICLCKILKDQN